MLSSRRFRASATIFLCLYCISSLADEFRQRGAHVHGVGTLGIATESGALVIELTVPAVNVVGFEHVPRSTADNAAIHDADLLFHQPAALFVLSAAADCKPSHTTVTSPQWEADDADAHEEPGEEHANYDVRWDFLCGHESALTYIEPRVFSKLKNMTQLSASVITSSRQGQQTITDASQRIQLK
jgi:hypothetical protein